MEQDKEEQQSASATQLKQTPYFRESKQGVAKSEKQEDSVMNSAQKQEREDREAEDGSAKDEFANSQIPQPKEDAMEDPAEQVHFKQVVSAFFFYQLEAMRDIARMERDFVQMPAWQHDMLSFDFRQDRIKKLKDCSIVNQRFLNMIVMQFQELFTTDQLPDGSVVMRPERVVVGDIEKMRSTLRQFVREWSSLGEAERNQAFNPIIEEVGDYFQGELGRPAFDESTGERISILFPGCGLGRLVFEMAKRQYRAIGNEFSYFCLLSSNFILNESEQVDQFTLHPWIHNFNNLKKDEHAFREVTLPDACPSLDMAEPEKYDFAMASGEFLDVFGEQTKKWDCIVTCFFIDTAHNVLEYMQTFNKILKVGGLWVNIGPLHWHYSEQPSEGQVQLSLEEIEHLVPKFGFEFRKKEMKQTSYTGRLDCLLNMSYESVFFSAVKVADFEPPRPTQQSKQQASSSV